MRAIRDLPIAASLLLVGLAVFFGGGPGDGALPWFGGAALALIVVLLATRGAPAGLTALVPLVLLALWCAVSISWSWLPDRSWDYANRTLVYALFAALGLWLAPRAGLVADALAVAVGAVVVWSLLGKVFPPIYDYGDVAVTARLRGPVGLWNQLALLADFGLVLALRRRGRMGALLVYVSTVALLLTYSRGGVLTAAVLLVAYLVLAERRIDAGALLAAGGAPAAVVVGIAFVLPGVTSDHQSLATRWRDGLVFGAVLVAGAAAAARLERLPRPRDTPALRRGIAAATVALAGAVVAVVAVRGFGSGAVTNGGGRFASTSSNFRLTWWSQAWNGFEHHLLTGTGAGSFHLVNLLYRSTYLDYTTEPHNLPLQFLVETGVVGGLLFLLSVVLLVRRRGPELVLALLFPAYLVHALVDVDWDFLAVSAPAFLAAGVVAGGSARRPLSGFATLAAAGCALLVFVSLLLPWLGRRWSNEALVAPAAQAFRLADRAHGADPLLVDPYWDRALAADTLGRTQVAFAWYKAAVARQPRNPETWLLAGEYALNTLDCPYAAYHYLERYTELDQKARPSEGGADYLRALDRVNHAQGTC